MSTYHPEGNSLLSLITTHRKEELALETLLLLQLVLLPLLPSGGSHYSCGTYLSAEWHGQHQQGTYLNKAGPDQATKATMVYLIGRGEHRE